jgi:hypothetical protein
MRLRFGSTIFYCFAAKRKRQIAGNETTRIIWPLQCVVADPGSQGNGAV